MQRERWMIDLPSKEEELEKMRKKYSTEAPLTPGLRNPKPGSGKTLQVNDGGSSWQAKRIQRVIEEAKESGKSLQEIAEQRFGSFENFLKLKKQISTTNSQSRDNKTKLEIKEKKVEIGPSFDGISIEQMYAEEKRSSGINESYARNVASAKRFNNSEDYLDEMGEQLANGKRKHDADTRSIKNNKKPLLEDITATCENCPDSECFDTSNVIASGYKVYVALPKSGALHNMHCQIIPYAHVSSLLQADEDVWEEVRNFKKTLIRMFDGINLGVIFLETCIDMSNKSHTIIEAIPVNRRIQEDAKMYFKKALIESDEEWNSHKKIVETATKGLRKSIPKEFPYFYVDFQLDSGYAHIVENEKKFALDFGKNVLGSMMGLDSTFWRKDSSTNTTRPVKQRVEMFKKSYKDYDWTTDL